jgi:hypothetical protein
MLAACLISVPLLLPVAEGPHGSSEATPWAEAPESYALISVSGSVPLDPGGQWTTAIRSADLQGLIVHFSQGVTWPEAAKLGEWEKDCASKGLALGFSFGERPSRERLSGLLNSCQALFCVSLPDHVGDGVDELEELVGQLMPIALGRGMTPTGGLSNESVFSLDAIRAWPLPRGQRVEDGWIAAYDQSVGQGRYVRLDLELDEAGRLRPEDLVFLARCGLAMEQTYGSNRAAGSIAWASSEDSDALHLASACLDGDVGSYWTPAPGTQRAFLELTLPKERIIDRVLLRAPLGAHAPDLSFEVHLKIHAVWREVARGTGLGRCRVLSVEPAPATALRVVVNRRDKRPALAACELYASPPRVTIDATETVFLGSSRVRLESTYPGAQVRYTLDGQAVTSDSSLYRTPFLLDRTCTLTAVAFATDGSTPVPSHQRFRRYTPATLRDPAVVGDLAAGLMRLESDSQMTSWIGFVSVPRDGIYAFFRSESVRTRLFVGEEDLFEWGGRLGEVGLKAGWHALRVECPAHLAPAKLQLEWRGPGLGKGILPAESLGHRGDKN